MKSGKWSGQMFSFSSFWEFDALLSPPSPLPMNQKPGKANFRELVSKKIPGGACPRAPLEACSLGPLFRKSVSIYPRSAPVRPILTVRGRRGHLSIFICFARLIAKS